MAKITELDYHGNPRDVVVFAENWYLSDLELAVDGIRFSDMERYCWEFEDADWIKLRHLRSGDGQHIISPYNGHRDGLGFLFSMRIRRIGAYVYVALSATPSEKKNPRDEKR